MDSYLPRSSDISSNELSPGQVKNPPKRKTKTVEYQGSLTAAQYRLPSDLLQSLRLHAIKEGISVSKLVQSCLTSEKMITKAHVTIRDAA